MFELVLTACLAAEPERCSDHVSGFETMAICRSEGAAHAQTWAAAHPDLVIEGWRCVAAGEKAAGFEEIAEGVFVHRAPHGIPDESNANDLSNAGFVVGEDAVAMIDAGGSALVGARLLAGVRAHTDKPVRYLILTHMHPDHILGAGAFKGVGATVIGHAKLSRAIAARAQTYEDNIRDLIGDAYEGTEVIAPDEGVETRREIDLGDRVLVLEAHPTAHTDNDLTVLDRQTGTWFLGDLLFVGHTPALDGSLTGWLTLMEALQGREVARAVPGHGPATLSWPEGAAPTQRYLQTLAEGVRAAIKRGDTMARAMESVGEEERALWELFDEFHRRNVTAAYKELEWE